LTEVAQLSGVSVRTVQRVVEEDAITTVDNAAERARREVGRPSTAEAYRATRACCCWRPVAGCSMLPGNGWC
jgi:hypothetical protein